MKHGVLKHDQTLKAALTRRLTHLQMLLHNIFLLVRACFPSLDQNHDRPFRNLLDHRLQVTDNPVVTLVDVNEPVVEYKQGAAGVVLGERQ